MAIYLVKAWINPTSKEEPNLKFKQLAFEGTYIPEQGKRKVLKVKIEEQCKEFLLKHLQNDHPELKFEFTNFKIERYKNDFTINANQK